MKQQPPIVTIKKPCHENWENMTPAQQGRFCQSCSKTVIDFSEMGDDAIIKHLKQSSGKVCGRFYDDQLNRELQTTPEIKSAPFLYKAAASLLLMAGIETADAHTAIPAIQTTLTEPGKNNGNADQENQKRFPPPTDCVDSSSVSLTVRNKKGQGIESTFWYQEMYVHSDENGNLKITLPDSMLKETMIFEIYARGYKRIKFGVTRKEIPLRKEIVLRALTKKEKKKRYRTMGCISF